MSTAELGLVINSSQVAPAVAALDKLTVAAGSAQTAANKLAPATAAAGAALGATEKAAKSASNAHAGYSTQAMAAFHATRSMAEGLAMGIPPSQMLAMQINHLAYAASGPGGLTGAFKEVGSMVAGMITPMRLLGVGVVATGAALFASFESWKDYALQLDDVRRITGETSQSLSALTTAASIKGVDNSEFFNAMRKFAGDVSDAKNGMGDLATLLRANGQAAGDFDTTLGRVADLIRNARDDQQRINLLQQAGLPTTRAWIDLLSNGAQGLRAAKDEAVAFGGAANDNMVAKAKEFDEAWNKAISNLKTEFRGLFGYVLDEFDQLALGARGLSVKFATATGGSPFEVGSGVLAGAMKGQFVAGANPTRLSNQMANDFYGAFGNRFAQPAATSSAVDAQLLQQQIQREQQIIALPGVVEPVAQPQEERPALSYERRRPSLRPRKENHDNDSDRYRKAA